MTERKWTDAQKEAIEHRGGHLILSAAAGSGKTDTLTERMIRLIGEGKDLSRMLCVTFTNAAAGELKERIGEALEKMILENPADRHAARCLASLDSAHISTIHSFFKSEITPYISKFKLPPEFRIMEEAESSIMKKEAMEETVSEFFDSPTDDFEHLCECISGAKDEAGLDSTLLSIRNALMSRGAKLSELLDESSDRGADIMAYSVFLPVTRLMDEAGRYFAEMFGYYQNEFIKLGGSKAPAEAFRLKELGERLQAASLKKYEEAKAFLEVESDFPRLSVGRDETSYEIYESFKGLRDEFKKLLKKLLERYFSLDEEKFKEISEEYSRLIKSLSEVIGRFEVLYAGKKQKRGCVDYDDLETFADTLFCNDDKTPTPAAYEVGKKYDCILIDEYQDTSYRQDRVFTALSYVTERFMVGDVKQSIYSFRGACPELFTEYRKRYSDNNGGKAIFLSDNFRSDQYIIDFSNIVSDYIFSFGKTPFEEDDRLVCSKPGGKDSPSPCEVTVIARKTDENGKLCEDFNYEAEYVAEKIVELLNSGEMETPSDAAVLLRSGTKAADFVDALTRRGIPVNNGAEEHFFSYGEVLLVLCLINAADNPLRDIYLAGALKSHVFSFTLEELVKIRSGDKNPLWYSLKAYDGDPVICEKCRYAVEKINYWRAMAQELDALEILRLILSDTDMIRYGGDGTRSSADVARSMKSLLSSAASVAKNGGNLHELTVYFEALVEKTDKAPFESIPGAVSILTIHKSKGLGFPVCFICDTAKKFSKEDLKKPFLFSPSGQLSMKITTGGLVRCSTPQFYAAAEDITRSITEEEARVLYVAMTRAKKRLYVVMSDKAPEEFIESAKERAEFPLTPYRIASCNSFRGWIIDAIMRNMPSKCFSLSILNWQDIGHTVYSPEEDAAESSTAYEFFKGAVPAEYEKDYLKSIPAKLTVSALKPDILNIAAEEASTIDTETTFFMPKDAPVPRFMQETEKRTAADAGTATHMFMQFCNFEELEKNGAAAELQRLVERRFISEEDAKIVYLPEIELFIKSDIFREMRDSKEVLREKRFNSRLPAEKFTTDPALREKLMRDNIKITVQGVVDCIFRDRDEKPALIDYKTDRLTKDELADKSLAEEKLLYRHRRQLTVYREVCSALLGEKIERTLIYSLPLGDTIEVK